MFTKTRFAPSPTGRMHVGNCRTALFNVLFAHHVDGGFLLRVEDSDQARSEAAYVETIKADLKWLMLDWTEGPDIGGEHAPYFQIERLPIYESYYKQLIQSNQAYKCYCSEAELSVHRKTQLTAGLPPRYSGACRHLTEEQCAQKEAEGKVAAIRLRVSDDELIRFTDLIQGPKEFNTKDLGDFIIKKQDGSPAFMFCNAIDDSLMGVTHAFRGEDHITNTPRQLYILKALGLRAPEYGHFPIIFGMDGKPLSKRNGSLSVEQLRNKGYLPLAVLNYLARLGHAYTQTELLSFEDLCQHFELSRVGRSPAKFDIKQLQYWQKEALKALPLAERLTWLGEALDEVPEDRKVLVSDILIETIILPHQALDEASIYTGDVYYCDDAMDEICVAEVEFFEAFLSIVEQPHESMKEVLERLKNETGRKGRELFMPVRLALTGQSHGPDFEKIYKAISLPLIQSRLRTLIKKLQD